MKALPVTDTASAADLQARWPTFKNDLDRALAIHVFHDAGTSLRELAKTLKCSPSLLRNLNQAAQATPEDQALARQGKISTRELVRRAKAAKARRAAKDREALDQKRMKEAQKGCKEICAWLEEEKLWPAHGENIVDEARRLLAAAEEDGKLPPHKAPPDKSLAEIIQRFRPPAFINDEVGSVGWYADWLVRWAYFSMPDSSIRHKALNLALDKQIKG